MTEQAATGIVCATDLSPESGGVVRVAAALARRLRAPLDLFHVVHVPPALPPDLFDKTLIGDLRVVAETKIEAQAAELRAAGIETTTSVRLGFIDDSIAHHAAQTRAELLVMGTHARGSAARAFMGSVAERTIRGAPCPTLVVPPEPISRLARGKPFSGPLKLTVGGRSVARQRQRALLAARPRPAAPLRSAPGSPVLAAARARAARLRTGGRLRGRSRR